MTDQGEIETGRDTIFHAFTLGDRKFIAFPYGNGITVIGENGDNYGNWFSEGKFRRCYKTGKPFPATVLGKATLSMRIES